MFFSLLLNVPYLLFVFCFSRRGIFRTALMKILDPTFVPLSLVGKKKAKSFKPPTSPNAFVNCYKMTDDEVGELLENVVKGTWTMIEFGKQCISYKAKRLVRFAVIHVLSDMFANEELEQVERSMLETGENWDWKKMEIHLPNATHPSFLQNWTAAAAKGKDDAKMGFQFEKQVRARIEQDVGALHFVSSCFFSLFFFF